MFGGRSTPGIQPKPTAPLAWSFAHLRADQRLEATRGVDAIPRVVVLADSAWFMKNRLRPPLPSNEMTWLTPLELNLEPAHCTDDAWLP